MQTVHPDGPASLNSLQHVLEQRIAGSIDHQRVGTRDARLIWFLKFLAKHNIADVFACNNLDRLFACYAITLLDGKSIKGTRIRVDTIKGYFKAINDHFVDSGRPKPIDFKSSSQLVKLLDDQAKFETQPKRRLLMTLAMTQVAMVQRTIDQDRLGLNCAIANWVGIGRFVGTRKCEFAQDKDDQVCYYIKPDGEMVVRAFTFDNVMFFDKNNAPVDKLALAAKDSVEGAAMEFDVQKNRMNGQLLKYKRGRAHPVFCIIEKLFGIVDRAHALGQPDDLPLGVYKDDDGTTKYLTGKVFTEYIRAIALQVMPGITSEDLALFSTHSLRVTACNLLHEAGKDGSYIKLRLCWKSDCFEIYLRNTETITVMI